MSGEAERAAAIRAEWEAEKPHSCYCLPGEARCDEPYNWCDRGERLDDVLGRVRGLLDEWEASEPGTPMLAVMGLRRALRDGGAL